ncbi:TetR/AcrR family transcriptional regulator [Hansschlegelia zhihuaiae]|nr:TetR/AcrR family transcriptional regulator [Hansschlegelia zhihuaiae]
METFWALGYEGASMAELTRAMGIGSPSLYAAFGSKEALFREATALYEREVGAELSQAIAEAPTAKEAVAAFLGLSAEALARPGRPPGCMIVLTAMSGHGACEATRAELKTRRAGSAAALEARLARAVARGELPEGLDLAAISRFYVTVQQGMSIQAVDGASFETLRDVADAAMAAWDRLTATPDADRAAVA